MTKDLVELINQVEALVGGREYDRAVYVYQAWLKDSDSTLSYVIDFNLGVLLENLGRFEDAELSYKSSLKSRPDFTQAQLRLAVLFERGGKLAEVVPHHPSSALLMTDLISGNSASAAAREQMAAEICDDGALDSSPTSIQPGETIRIVFLAQYPAVWSSLRSVWSAASMDPRFCAKVVVTPFLHPNSSEVVTYDDMRQCLIGESIPFCTSEFFELKAFNPHIVFVQNPYEQTRPEKYQIKQLKLAGARMAYVPYGLEIGGGAWNVAAQFDSYLHRSAWRIFSRSERHKKMFGKYCSAGNSHVVVTGHPKFDVPKVSLNNLDPNELTHKIAGRKVILWTPHFSVGDPPTWSTYKRYGEYIREEMCRRPDLFLLIRPHPMFLKAMLQHKEWDRDGAQNFRQIVNASGNMMLDESPDYRESFAVSSALMADVGSFLLEYLPTGKPILYLHCENGLGMNDDGDLVRHLYAAFNVRDIANFIEMVACGYDPKKAEREAALPEYLFGLDGNVGERICQHIHAAVNGSDTWSPAQCEDSTNGQTRSETFWRTASNTYLAAADYYERKEIILNQVLARMPKIGNVIDIGCGDGRFTYLLAKYSNEVAGCDVSPSLVAKARAGATSGVIDNVTFVVQELATVAPFVKYDLVACMGVTSCIIDNAKFLQILSKFALLSRLGGYLILTDTLSANQEQTFLDPSGCIAKYRSLDDYRSLVLRRGYKLNEEVLISENSEKNLVNKLFLFESCTSPVSQ